MSTNATADDTRPIDPDDELLVAYLDGELDSHTRDELEERLLDDETLRQKLQSLQTGWEMLDVLPAPTTNERLVESTLEMVVSDIMKVAPSTEVAPKNQSKGPLIVVGVSLLAIAIGWFAGHRYRVGIERQQLANLALAENFDAYLWGSDQSLMRTLQANPAWLNMISTASEAGQLNTDTITVIQETPVKERFDVIAGLDDNQRATLSTRWDDLASLDPETMRKVRETAEAVAVQKDSKMLLDTMSKYAVWRSSLPNDLSDAIEGSQGVKQKRAIDEAISYTLESVSRRSGGMLDEDTVLRIDHALNMFLDERLEQNPQARKMLDGLTETFGEGARLLLIGQMLSRDRYDERSRERPSENGNGRGGGRGRGGRSRFPLPPGFVPVEPITIEELDSLTTILSDKAMADLESLTNWSRFAGHDPGLLDSTLRAWAEETLRRKRDKLRPEQESLIQRYTQLSARERDELDLMPPSEIKRRLSSRWRPPFGR